MKLKKLRLKNFRSYRDEEFDFNDLNVIIGKNDAGKSTILDALNIFFNGSPDINDLNVQSEEKLIEISCAFEVDGNAQIQLDSSENTTTTLQDEYLLNKDGLLEFCKCYEGEKLKEKSYLISRHPNNFDKSLITLKINELKRQLADKGIDTSEINKTIKKDLRRALFSSEKLTFVDDYKIDANVRDTDILEIYTKFSSKFPDFLLFKADRTNTDKDSEMADTLTAITKTAVNEVTEQFETIKEIIKSEINKVAEKTLSKLKEFDNNIAQGLNHEIKNKPLEKIFEFSFNDEKGVSFNKRGSGVKRLMLLSFFLAEAERQTLSTKDIIYAIEEPETSQHPDFQQKLIGALKDLSFQAHKQILITTHTPEIVRLVDRENLIFLQKDEEDNIIKQQNNEIEISKVRDTLGILPFIVYKNVILVEGQNDVNFLLNLSKYIKELRNIINLKDYTLIPLGGCKNVDRWIKEDYLQASNVKCLYFKDNDNQEHYLLEKQDNVIVTKRREIENYIPQNIIEEEFKITLGTDFNWDTTDIPTLIKEKGIMLDEKDIKKILSGKKEIWEKMQAQQYYIDEFVEWFNKIKTYFNE